MNDAKRRQLGEGSSACVPRRALRQVRMTARDAGARKRGPSGDLTAETRVRPVVTRYWPVTRSHPRKRGPCSTFHRPVTPQAPHLAQPNDISTLSRDRAIRVEGKTAGTRVAGRL